MNMNAILVDFDRTHDKAELAANIRTFIRSVDPRVNAGLEALMVMLETSVSPEECSCLTDEDHAALVDADDVGEWSKKPDTTVQDRLDVCSPWFEGFVENKECTEEFLGAVMDAFDKANAYQMVLDHVVGRLKNLGEVVPLVVDEAPADTGERE